MAEYFNLYQLIVEMMTTGRREE